MGALYTVFDTRDGRVVRSGSAESPRVRDVLRERLAEHEEMLDDVHLRPRDYRVDPETRAVERRNVAQKARRLPRDEEG